MTSWVRKRHPQICDPVPIPCRKDWDEFRTMTVLPYLEALHNGCDDENDDYDYEYEDDDLRPMELLSPNDPNHNHQQTGSGDHSTKENHDSNNHRLNIQVDPELADSSTNGHGTEVLPNQRRQSGSRRRNVLFGCLGVKDRCKQS